jgi:hypothetical protein
METFNVSTVNEAITVLQGIKDRHGDLQMLNEEGGAYQFSAVIWGKEDHQGAGGELRDGVTVDGVRMAGVRSAVAPELEGKKQGVCHG